MATKAWETRKNRSAKAPGVGALINAEYLQATDPDRRENPYYVVVGEDRYYGATPEDALQRAKVKVGQVFDDKYFEAAQQESSMLGRTGSALQSFGSKVKGAFTRNPTGSVTPEPTKDEIPMIQNPMLSTTASTAAPPAGVNKKVLNSLTAGYKTTPSKGAANTSTNPSLPGIVATAGGGRLPRRKQTRSRSRSCSRARKQTHKMKRRSRSRSRSRRHRR